MKITTQDLKAAMEGRGWMVAGAVVAALLKNGHAGLKAANKSERTAAVNGALLARKGREVEVGIASEHAPVQRCFRWIG